METCSVCNNSANLAYYTCTTYDDIQILCPEHTCFGCYEVETSDKFTSFSKIHTDFILGSNVPILNISCSCETFLDKTGKCPNCFKSKKKNKSNMTIVKSLAGTEIKYLQGQIKVVSPVFRMQIGLDFNYNRFYGAVVDQNLKSKEDLNKFMALYKQSFKLDSFHPGSTEQYGKVLVRPLEDYIKWQVPIPHASENISNDFHLNNNDTELVSYWSFITENLFSELFSIFELIGGKL